MFWTEDIKELLKPVLVPTDYMSFEEKLNALTRLVFFICAILALILRETKIVLLMIILIILIVCIYYYQKQFQMKGDSFLNENDLDVIDAQICKKPSKHNPFMNPVLTDIAKEPACPIDNEKVLQLVDKYFDESMYRNVDDIYDRTTSKRQFYSVPVKQIPNDQSEFANWLYNRGASCKENNPIQCYNNMYRDLRI